MNLQTPIKLTHQQYASRLEKLGIQKLEDFLYHVPFRYDNFSLIAKIGTVQEGEIVTIIGKVENITNAYTKGYKKIQKATITDDTGTMEIMWFNQPYLAKVIHKGDTIALAGRIEKSGVKVTILSPEYEVLHNGVKPIHTGRLVPIYPETKGVSSKWLRRQIYKVLQDHNPSLQEFLPDETLSNNNLLTISLALEQIHFPDKLEQADYARMRLAFDELFLLQLKGMIKRHEWKQTLRGNRFIVETHKESIDTLLKSLPFVLTQAQQKAINDVFEDVKNQAPMNRLVQGDVGSGKTIVAAIAMYLAHLNNFQSVLMAPTEILAIQHYGTIKKLLENFNITVALATGGKKDNIDNFDIIVGTHALLSEKINYQNLGLIVIDEQQRFGVEQRSILRSKGNNPHLLTMTATPIPRTVALTMYGNLDLSYLNEMPKGRKYIKTWLVPENKRNSAYDWIRQQIKDTHSQVFVICPFIEESESMTTIKAAIKEYEKLKKEIFSDLKLGLLHGKLKPKEKDDVLKKFKDKEFDILVATPVVEVGIDIPNATVIVIEASERFGLAQLHQLRGRVGRGEKQSYCLLFTQTRSPQTFERLKSMEKMHNGAELAELDLKLRGPGDIYGTLQSGLPMLKIANFSDTNLIIRAKKEAEKVFSHLHTYPKLVKKLDEVNIKQVSPD